MNDEQYDVLDEASWQQTQGPLLAAAGHIEVHQKSAPRPPEVIESDRKLKKRKGHKPKRKREEREKIFSSFQHEDEDYPVGACRTPQEDELLAEFSKEVGEHGLVLNEKFVWCHLCHEPFSMNKLNNPNNWRKHLDSCQKPGKVKQTHRFEVDFLREGFKLQAEFNKAQQVCTHNNTTINAWCRN